MSEPNYHTTKYFSENLLEIEMNKPVYLGFSILEISKTLMYEYWHDYIKPKYQNNAKTMLYGYLFILKLKIFL